MERVQDLRRRRSPRDRMNNGKRIQHYLRIVRASLYVPSAQRRRVLEEIESHLDDSVAAHMRDGGTRDEAIALAIDELGPPDAVAAAFNEKGPQAPAHTGAAGWLPILLPLFLFMAAVGVLVWSLTWIPGGWSSGEKVAQRTYLRSAVIAGVFSYATYFSIRRSRSDQTWRWAAWFCAGLTLLLILGLLTR